MGLLSRGLSLRRRRHPAKASHRCILIVFDYGFASLNLNEGLKSKDVKILRIMLLRKKLDKKI